MSFRFALPPNLPTAHKGLVLDRFIGPKDEGQKKDEKAGASRLAAVTRINSATPAYKLAFERWKAASSSIPHAAGFDGVVQSKMALGLGIESVLEIGCRLHATYGVPVIPGSSLKGVVQAAMAADGRRPVAIDAARWKEIEAFLFGSQDAAGFARFYDAWWVPEDGKSGLVLDVVTPHHSGYYTQGKAPVETESPVPVQFLAVTGKFRFVIGAPNDEWKVQLEALVKQVLQQFGVGGKRNSGYGRFRF